MTTPASGTISAFNLSQEVGSYTPVDLNSRRFRALALKQQASGTTIALSDFYSKTWHYEEPIYRTSTSGGTTAGPVNNYYRRELIKVVYENAEFTDSGWGTGANGDIIYELTVNVANVPTYQPYPNYRIYMQNVSSTGDVDLTSGWTLVYTGSSQSFTVGENSFILDTYFNRTAGSNLAICWAWDQSPTNWSATGTASIDTVSGKAWRYAWTDAAGSFQPTEAAGNLSYSNRPSPRFRRAPFTYRPLDGSSLTSNGTTSPSPVNNYFRRIVFKSIFSSAEMKTALGWPSYGAKNTQIYIYRIGIYITQVPTYQPYPNYKVYMANTATAPGSDLTSGWTQIYTNSSQSFSAGDFTIAANFVWTTGSNLAICWAWGQSPTSWSTTGQAYVYSNGNSNYSWTDSAGEYFATDSAPSTVAYRPYVNFYSNSKIICTKLNELGLLPDDIYNVDQEFGIMLAKNDPDAHAGYLAWAVLVVDWMDGEGIKIMPWMSDEQFKESISKWAIKWAHDLASPWALEMSRLQGATDSSPWAGKFMMAVGMPLSRFIGRWKKRFPRKTDPGLGTGLTMVGVFCLLKLAVGTINAAESLWKRITSRKGS